MTEHHHRFADPTLADVVNETIDEVGHARDKFGDQFDLADLEWLAVLTEELGEAAMAVTKREVRPVRITADTPTSADLRAEVVQIAAVALRWVRTIDERDR